MSSKEITHDSVAYLEARLSELRDLEKGKVKCQKCDGCGFQADPTIAELSIQQVAAIKANDQEKVQAILKQIQQLVDEGRKEEYECFDCAGSGKQRPLMGLSYIIEELEKALEVAKYDKLRHEVEVARD